MHRSGTWSTPWDQRRFVPTPLSVAPRCPWPSNWRRPCRRPGRLPENRIEGQHFMHGYYPTGSPFHQGSLLCAFINMDKVFTGKTCAFKVKMPLPPSPQIPTYPAFCLNKSRVIEAYEPLNPSIKLAVKIISR